MHVCTPFLKSKCVLLWTSVQLLETSYKIFFKYIIVHWQYVGDSTPRSHNHHLYILHTVVRFQNWQDAPHEYLIVNERVNYNVVHVTILKRQIAWLCILKSVHMETKIVICRISLWINGLIVIYTWLWNRSFGNVATFSMYYLWLWFSEASSIFKFQFMRLESTGKFSESQLMEFQLMSPFTQIVISWYFTKI